MRPMWAALAFLLGTMPAWSAASSAGMSSVAGLSKGRIEVAQRKNVEVRTLDTVTLPGASEDSKNKPAAAPKTTSPGTKPAAPVATPQEPAKPVAAEPKATVPEAVAPAQPAAAVPPATPAPPSKVRRPTESGDRSGGPVAAFWFISPGK